MDYVDQHWASLESKWASAHCPPQQRDCGLLLRQIWRVWVQDNSSVFFLGSRQLERLNGYPGVKLVFGPSELKFKRRLVQLQIVASESTPGYVELRLFVLKQRSMPRPTIPTPLKYMVLKRWLADSRESQRAKDAQEILTFADGYTRGLARCDERYSQRWFRP